MMTLTNTTCYNLTLNHPFNTQRKHKHDKHEKIKLQTQDQQQNVKFTGANIYWCVGPTDGPAQNSNQKHLYPLTYKNAYLEKIMAHLPSFWFDTQKTMKDAHPTPVWNTNKQKDVKRDGGHDVSCFKSKHNPQPARIPVIHEWRSPKIQQWHTREHEE